MNIDINDEMLEIMKRKGIECVQDIDRILYDGCGNIIDILPKQPDIFEELKTKEPGESFNSCRARNGFDMVNHTKYYKAKKGMEVIDVIEEFTVNLEGYEENNLLEYLKKAQ